MMTPEERKREQEATLARPTRNYTSMARFFFRAMDLLYGRELTLNKVRLLEILARIPYQAWEIHYYHRMNRHFEDDAAVEEAEEVINWSREAQDNEFWHLLMSTEKLKQEQGKLHWFKDRLAPPIAVVFYILFSGSLAFFNMRAAYRLNADFEDHAEHEYMKFAQEHPQWEHQPVDFPVATRHANFASWADVFRWIALDERAHMNNSLVHAGRTEEVVRPVSSPGS